MNDLRVDDWGFQFVETLQAGAIIAAEIRKIVNIDNEKCSAYSYLLNSSNAFAVNEDELPLEETDSFIFYWFKDLIILMKFILVESETFSQIKIYSFPNILKDLFFFFLFTKWYKGDV